MIIWINGAFGAGKTQTAYTLQRRMPDAYVYDPENAGCFIRKNLPPALHTDDFQDYPMWRSVTLEMLTYLAKHHAGDIIVPMTITNRAYYEEIIGTLSKEYALRHYILYAQDETIRRRLASRLEGKQSWAALQTGRCLRAFDTEITEERIDTDHLDVEQTAGRIAALSGIQLAEDRRSGLRRRWDRVVTQCRHIR